MTTTTRSETAARTVLLHRTAALRRLRHEEALGVLAADGDVWTAFSVSPLTTA